MRPLCDYCGEELPEGTAPKVDANDRPVELVCRRCDLEAMTQRARRLGIPVSDEAALLIDQFQDVLEREIRPRLRLGH